MTENFKDMLSFYAWGATGYKNIIEKEYDYEQILSLAKKQGVFHIVYSVLKQYSQDEAVANLNTRYFMSVLNHQSRMEAMENIIKKPTTTQARPIYSACGTDVSICTAYFLIN